MNTVELQNSLIKKILDTKDSQVLQYLNSILSTEKPYQLSDFEQQVVSESLAEYKKGNTSTNEEVFSKTEKWLED